MTADSAHLSDTPLVQQLVPHPRNHVDQRGNSDASRRAFQGKPDLPSPPVPSEEVSSGVDPPLVHPEGSTGAVRVVYSPKMRGK